MLKKTCVVINILLLAVPLTGCGAYYSYYVSGASNREMVGKGVEKRLVLPDVEVAVRARNDVLTYERIDVIIIPVYINSTNRKVHNGPFRMSVQFFPKETGFTFIPGEVLLAVGEHESLRPIKFYGPRPYSQDRAENNRGVSSRWPGVKTGCGDLEYGEEVFNTDVRTEVDVEYLQLWNCFELTFNVDTPDAADPMSLEIKGLRRNGKPYEVPIIHFEKEKYYEVDSAP